jgi:preprotein translocase subunit SecA
MADHALPQPGLIWGLYPEKRPPADGGWLRALDRAARRIARPGLRRYERIARRSLAIESGLRTLSREAFDDAVRTLRQQLARDGFSEDALVQAFALIGEACRRHLGLSPFATQRIAAAIMLDNRLAEMATGEGKTLVAALTAATGALAGMPVHVVTANEYLVGRDADKLRPLYAALGLSVGAIRQADDSAARRVEYARDIVYCTAKELVFDYLRDLPLRSRFKTHLAWQTAQFCDVRGAHATLLRGLCMAVVDEADSILIDEARVPLIISELQDNAARREAVADILRLAAALRPGTDFTLDRHAQSAALTDAGRQAVESQAGGLHPVWHNRRHRDESLSLALAALHLFQRDRHYLVRDGGVHIVDETTGRLAPGRTWSRGLHQFIEMKEQCAPSGEAVTRAQITYQRFFPRYFRLCGMSGTLAESRGELASVYGLNVMRVPLRLPGRRIDLGQRMFLRRAQQWQAVAQRAAACLVAQRPLLIGTDSVADSDSLSLHLTQCGIAHTVLNARNDQHEADIVALAGHAGHVTVATNMAGRGTDIPLGPGVDERGGLHVISCQMNSARRIDRQLKGRCARQGNAGSVETLLCLEAPLMQRSVPAWLIKWVVKSTAVIASAPSPQPSPRGRGGKRHVQTDSSKQSSVSAHSTISGSPRHFVPRDDEINGQLPVWLGRALTFYVQRMEESRQQAQRAQLLHSDRQLDRQAVFRD